ncbi:MAG TPA: recombinase [Planctomycetota bacterium]|nr:recombinase [Planctomycetota bacterium]
MTLAQLQDYVFHTKYARFRPDLGRRETFQEAVSRVMAMHRRRYAGTGIDAELDEAEAAMRARLVLGSQRALQFGGPPIERKHARLYNCTVSYCNRPRFFQEALWLLLCGCGVGFSVQGHHVARLPRLVAPAGEAVFAAPDSIEGWADALGALVSGYLPPGDAPLPAYAGRRVRFDLSAIRPEGAALSSAGGKAPGPKPLARSLERIRAILDARVAGDGRLKPIDCYDMVMHASDAVLSGGVRRSATICLFSPDDHEMATAKTGDWFVKHPQRGRSNNSALLLRDGTTRARFDELMRHVREFGEPGFVWADSTEIMYNPCVEIGMWPVDAATGASGWAFCNLCEINMKACATPDLFASAARAAAILGTLQAGYDEFPYLGATTEAIVRREALLGCSMTGMMDNPALAFDPQLQRRMATLILEVNAAVAARIGVNPAARATCVKPAGTTSSILGTASGIHAHHARRYLRRVQANYGDAPLRFFAAHNPRAIERSVWNPNGTDGVITFCIDVPPGARTANEIGAIELLRHVELTRRNWVDAGRRPERCAQPWLTHNVSNTITVLDDEWEAVAEHLYAHRDAFAGVSLLPAGGDLDYPQAPFVAVWTPEEIVARHGVGALVASGLIVDGERAFAGDLWAACAAALGVGEDVGPGGGTAADKRDWVARAQQFASRYFAGDLREMTHCLKRVHHAKRWEDLAREYVPVDWTRMRETSDATGRVELDPACIGGQCAI